MKNTDEKRWLCQERKLHAAIVTHEGYIHSLLQSSFHITLGCKVPHTSAFPQWVKIDLESQLHKMLHISWRHLEWRVLCRLTFRSFGMPTSWYFNDTRSDHIWPSNFFYLHSAPLQPHISIWHRGLIPYREPSRPSILSFDAMSAPTMNQPPQPSPYYTNPQVQHAPPLEEHNNKRKAENNENQTPQRSKRNRYISIAWYVIQVPVSVRFWPRVNWRRVVHSNECKRRKIKCNGQTPCQRCEKLELECIYAPNCCSSSFKDSEYALLSEVYFSHADYVQENLRPWALTSHLFSSK